MNSNYSFRELNAAKILLMFGVVLIHCNVSCNINEAITFRNVLGIDIVKFISSFLCDACVPSFFIISGFLYFKNIDVNSSSKKLISTYKRKIKSRFESLVIPAAPRS